jgi:hypothetical protein
MSKPLRKIAEVSIKGTIYHVSQNGAFCLVLNTKTDAYGTAVWEITTPESWANADGAQTLIDEIGYAHQTIAAQREEIDKLRTALQRESEPEARPRRRVEARESTAGISGVLESPPNQGLPERADPK